MTRKRRAKRKVLRSKKLLLGVTGSIAAYRAPDIIRRLKDNGASVEVIMTDASSRFITPMTIEAVLGGPVHMGMFDRPMAHIDLSANADALLIAPASANTIGKIAGGLADDLLSTCAMAFRGPVVIAPAMNWRMYDSAAFQRNLKALKDAGVVEVEPETGSLACGEMGRGRMAPVDDIIEAVHGALSTKDIAGRRVVVTAGPTREFIDSVRYITNRSSGKMGYAAARAAIRRGANVTLISGPSALSVPRGAQFVSVTTAEEMRRAVMEAIGRADMLVMAAAVADFAPVAHKEGKLPKNAIPEIKLVKTVDILAEVGRMKKRPVLVGFAAEAGEELERARKKMKDKGVDMLVFNNVSDPEAGFDVDTNRVTLLMPGGGEARLPLMSKDEVADAILDRAVGQMDK